MFKTIILLFFTAFVCACIGACKQNVQPHNAGALAAPPPEPSPGPQALPPIIVKGKKMNGLTMVAPPAPFPSDPMGPVKAVGAGWIAVVPYAYTRLHVPAVRYEETDWQWWGERPEGVKETIRRAHAAGVKVMLKPQIYIPYGWTGSMDYQSDEDWAKWEKAYEAYMLPMAKTAESMDVELFCIGTEFRTAIAKRPEFWRGLIAQIRSVYKGRLVYSSNWDDWEQIPFWDALDYIGLSGYFPLVSGKTPAIDSLTQAWAPIKDRLAAFSKKHDKPVLFTEFGYLSVDGCGWRNWELENGIQNRPINEQAQAHCFEALFSVFQAEPWWAGGFLWKWFPNGQGHEGYPERDYTPQGKLGEKSIQRWYSAGNN